MLFSRTLAAGIALLFIGSAVAFPLPMPLRLATQQRREPAALDTIPVYVKRQASQPLQTFPAEIAVKSPSGVIEQYKRAIPVEVAVQAPNGVTEVYKRQAAQVEQTVPVDVTAKAPNGVIEKYRRQNAQVEDTVPVDTAAKAPNGVIEKYKRDGIHARIPSEIPLDR